jgi:Arc/MetJ family transcription regulator
MRTTINLDDNLVARAVELSGIREKTALIHAALQFLVQKKAGERLAALGGTMPGLRPPRRRRSR